MGCDSFRKPSARVFGIEEGHKSCRHQRMPCRRVSARTVLIQSSSRPDPSRNMPATALTAECLRLSHYRRGTFCADQSFLPSATDLESNCDLGRLREG